MANTNDFKISLCEVGECESCLFSYCCPCFAISQARTYIDDSPLIFNCCCMSHITGRWLIRSAYSIPGDACADCYTSVFCPCCAANQAYQTAKARGHPVDNGGRYANVNAFITPLPPRDATAKNYLYSCFCMPCAIGYMLERAIGMPWYLGCLCTNVPTARNLMRYQYRIAGNDVMEELAVPVGASCVSNIVQQCFPCAGCVLWGAYATVVTQLGLEAAARPALKDPNSSQPPAPYLSGSAAPMLPPPSVLQQQSVSPVHMAMAYPSQQQQGVHMGTLQYGPPPSAIQVYTHEQPIIGSAIPLNNMGGGGGSGYNRVSSAELIKDHSY